MLKSFFGIFEATEAQLRPAAINRLKLASWASLLFAPLLALYNFGGIEDGSAMKGPIAFMLLISFIGFTIMGFPRVFNRIWTPDRYLDESEISRKREVNSFAFVWFISALMVALFGFIGLEILSPNPLTLSAEYSSLLATAFSVLVFAMSLQGIKLSQLLRPLDQEAGETVHKTNADKYYAVGALTYIIGVTGLAYILNG